ncbi:hypothetical protein PVAND_012329 [Polypedilum vanderplanki]|uniref:Uncharacterized protein n=1 Tax=Polypedilum vanderplanki TaxID=319348 RepID=A0A9J6CN14_POLVA|nr:hypothetical protein PVAND_012329 [Polypedilum vanderplanki]
MSEATTAAEKFPEVYNRIWRRYFQSSVSLLALPKEHDDQEYDISLMPKQDIADSVESSILICLTSGQRVESERPCKWLRNEALGFVSKTTTSAISRDFFARDQSRMTSIAQDLERGRYGAAPVPSSFDTKRANSSTFSFPEIPECPGTQISMTWFSCAQPIE